MDNIIISKAKIAESFSEPLERPSLGNIVHPWKDKLKRKFMP